MTGTTTLEVSARRAAPPRAARAELLRAFAQGGDGAIASARAIVTAYPGFALAWKILAVGLGNDGRLEEAVAAARQVIALAPRDAEGHRNLAALLQRTGAREDAIGSWRTALGLVPDHAPSHRHLGALLREAGRLEEAQTHGEAATRLEPADAENHHALGVTLHLRDRPAEAAECHRAAIARAPDHGAAHRNLGAALKELGRFDEALAALDTAVALRPGDADAHNNRGVVLEELGRFADALAAIDRALALRPAHAQAHANRGAILVDLRRFAEALDSYDRCLVLAPGDIGAQWNRSLALLSLGRMREGWALHEERWRIRGAPTPRATSRPRWTGAPGQEVAGRTILLWGEQGLGDQIQFARFAAQVAARGARVLLETAPRLAPLMEGLAGVVRVTRSDDPVPDEAFDLHCPLMSVPAALGTELATIPAEVPYLRVPEQARVRWAARLGPPARRPRVGIAWSGNPAHANDARRSIPLARLGALLDAPVEWIGLQRDLRDADRASLRDLPQLRHCGDALADFADTAALCAACDLVISVDTSVAHLAGALGRPVWILLPFNADWRWLHDRTDSPWYPTATLHRQARPGDWDGVLEHVARALAAWIAARGEAPVAPAPTLPAWSEPPPAASAQQLLGAGRIAEALAVLDTVLAAAPGDGDAWRDRGAALLALSRHEEALESLTRAVALRPGSAEAHNNRAYALVRLGRLDEALDSADQAIRLRPGWSVGHTTRGLALRRTGQLAAARAAYRRAIACDPADGRARNNLALATLAEGDLDQGWRLHEDRWLRPGAEPRRVSGRPSWTGTEPVRGRTLLLTGEQGLGDQIQFVRYAPLCAARGARVVLEVAAPLARLFAEVTGVADVVASPLRLPDDRFDVHCPLMSLPLAFATSLDTVPAQVPYLRVPVAAQEAWSGALATGPRPVIGIAWSGNPAHSGDRERSLALSRLAPLLDRRATWVSLQREVRPGDRAALSGGPGIVHFGERLGDCADTAALCASCDLVISVDTSVAHLAGALGRPVWILLPFAADWRWLTERTDSPWYPTARLYRQARPGDWDGVLARVTQDLARWIGARAPVTLRDAVAAAPGRAAIDALMRAHRAGDAEDALRRADAILAAFPDVALAHKIRAAVLAARGATDAAHEAMERAVAAAPDDAEAWRNLALLAQRLGRQDAAIAAWRRALALEPGRAADHGALARLLHAAGDREAAVASYMQALRLEPDDAGRRNDLAVALAELGRLEEAEAALRAAIARAPGDAHAHANLALLLRRRDRMDEAIEVQATAVALSPGAAAPCVVLGDMLCLAQRHAQALESYDRALELKPEDGVAHGRRGLALQYLGRTGEALAAFDRAIALAPGFADGHINRGLLLRDLGRPEEARVCLDRAVALTPDSPAAHVNLGLMLRDLGHADAALARYEHAIALAPEDALPHWNKGLVLLTEGRFEEGWRLYERRWREASRRDSSADLSLIWQPAGATAQRRTGRPVWRGDDALEGRTILLWREQGFGDQIQFARYARMVAARGARVLLEVDRPLLRLMRGLEGVAAIAPADTPFADDEFDVHCPLMTLPLAFGTRLETIPAPVPYLRAPAAAMAMWEPLLGAARRPRIGIAWSGHPGHSEDGRRSVALARLAPLLDARVEWISLQRDVRPTDEVALGQLAGLRHFATRLEDFADTAALCAQCDLVIAVDTSVVHLAGALGRPVWILLPFAADWRWLRGRTDSPWYPTARLYRQEAPGDWDSVLARVARDLAAWIAGPATDRMKPPGAPC